MFSLREAAALIPGAHRARRRQRHVRTRVAPTAARCRSGDLFVALKGERFDAHDFLPEVASRNVSAALVDAHAGKTGTCPHCA